MDSEQAPDEVIDPTPDTPTDSTDWAKRYNDLRPEFDRTSQELAQYRQLIEALSDPDRAPEALSALGYEFEQDTPEEEPQTYEDPTEALRKELEQIKEQLTAEKAEQSRQQYLAESLEKLASEVGKDFDQDEVQLLVDLAERMPDAKGRPQVKAAFERLTGYEEKIKKSYPQTKQAPKPGSGQPGAPSLDTSTEQGRIDALLARMEHHSAE